MSLLSISRARLLLALFVISSGVGCDQATKYAATETLAGEPTRSFLGDTVQLSFAMNPGGFLSLGGTLPSPLRQCFFVGLNSVFMIAIAVFLLRKANINITMFVALALILAGGIGNLIDRVRHDGFVTDFIVLRLGPLRTGVFNIADVAVTLGVGILFLLSLRRDGGEQDGQPELPMTGF
ncbi:MAG: signal peptidase II [Planctomyces sp.]|nr:signal peptidase II [Planctomyces sp.]